MCNVADVGKISNIRFLVVFDNCLFSQKWPPHPPALAVELTIQIDLRGGFYPTIIRGIEIE
jgi:hypothetical protein